MPLDGGDKPSDYDLKTWVESLHLENKYSHYLSIAPCSLERGMLALDSLSMILFGKVLECFLTKYLKKFGGEPLHAKYQKKCFDKAFKEEAHRLSRDLLKRYLDGDGPLALNAAAEVLWKKSDEKFTYNKNSKLRDGMLSKLSAVRLWNVKMIGSGERVECYEISAGPALILFFEQVFVPMRRKQLRCFFEDFGGKP